LATNPNHQNAANTPNRHDEDSRREDSHDKKDAGEMSFWGHLDQLRSVIFKIAGVVIALSIGFFFVMKTLFDKVILAPCSSDFITYRMFDFLHGDGEFLPDMSGLDFSVSLININLGTQLMTHLSASMWFGIIFSFPVIIYLLWTFVSPALYENEKRGARRAFLFGNAMFFLGVLVAYFIVFPLVLRFLSQYQLSDKIVNTLTLDSYMDSFYTIALSMGVVFELPLVAWLLGKMGLLKRSFFSRFRRHAIVALLITAALITPTSDVFTLAIVFVPLYMLWEFSSRLVPKDEAKD
jgi:sec-independent protein translocase protein TatC